MPRCLSHYYTVIKCQLLVLYLDGLSQAILVSKSVCRERGGHSDAEVDGRVYGGHIPTLREMPVSVADIFRR